MLSDFYGAFAPLTFTVFGLWLVVVQTRHADWARSPVHRRRAYAVSLHFAIPGLMSLLSLGVQFGQGWRLGRPASW